MNWAKEFHGSNDFGWRADGAYVARSAKKWWGLWLQDANGDWKKQPGAYANAEHAKADAEAAVAA